MGHAPPSAVDQVFRHWDPTWQLNPGQLISYLKECEKVHDLPEIPFVNIQNVADYCNRGRGTNTGMKYQRIGRCFSPWRGSMVFWREPLRDLGTANKLALVMQAPMGEEDSYAVMNGVIFQHESKGGPWTCISGMFCLAIPRDGQLEETDDGLQVFKMVVAGDPRSPVSDPSFSIIRPIAEVITTRLDVKAIDNIHFVAPNNTWVKDTQCDIQILLSAFSFAHCKNVQVVEGGRTEPPPRWRKENHVPSVKYRVVKIDTRMSKRSSGPHTDTGRHMSMHIARGHFKHYTAEKPLLGKHVGTYWWADSVRGDATAGEVKKAYEIKT